MHGSLWALIPMAHLPGAGGRQRQITAAGGLAEIQLDFVVSSLWCGPERQRQPRPLTGP
jgi:hypothetical protein